MDSKTFWRIIEQMFDMKDLSRYKGNDKGWIIESRVKMKQIL